MPDDAALDPKVAAALAPSVVEALESWLTDAGMRISLDRWMTAGNTRAVVAVVVVTGSGPPRKVILKACPPDRLTSREPRLHAQRSQKLRPTSRPVISLSSRTTPSKALTSGASSFKLSLAIPSRPSGP